VSSATLQQAPEAPEKVNAFGRLVGVIFSPKETFESIARRPNWLLPILLVTIATLCIIGLFGRRVGWRPFFERQDSAASRFEQLSAQQKEQTLNAQVRFGPIAVYVIGAISVSIVAVVIAAVLFGVFNWIFGAKFGFKTAMGIVTHSLVPGIILALLGVFVLFVKDPATVDLQNLVASNGGAFTSSDTPKWLSTLLTSLDLFTFWQMALMAIGFSAAAPKKLSFGKAFATIFFLWAVVVMFRVGVAAAFA
jgi:Yip1 domain